MLPQGIASRFLDRPLPNPVVGRMAPTPSGFLHLGNAANLLLNWLLVRSSGGTLMLRIDDMDSQRMRMPYLDDIFTTLEWLGLTYDIGPSGSSHFLAEWSQHHRLSLYREWLNKLQVGGQLYACQCSRAMVLARTGSLRYDGYCRQTKLPYAPNLPLRLQLTNEDCKVQVWHGPSILVNPAADMGDPVVWKKDNQPAYQLTSVADDVHFGITLAARGSDLMASSACQTQLHYCATGRPLPVMLLHHQLMKDGSGHKLSKRTAQSPHSLKTLYTRQEVFRQAATLLGLPQKKSAVCAADFLEDVP